MMGDCEDASVEKHGNSEGEDTVKKTKGVKSDIAMTEENDCQDKTETNRKRGIENVDTQENNTKKFCSDNLTTDIENEVHIGEDKTPVSSSSIKTSNNDSSTSTKACPSASDSQNEEKSECSSKVQSLSENEEETKKDNESKDEGLDETTSKLLASGISISLIKKPEESQESNSDTATVEAQSIAKENKKSNSLELGSNISVTMINKPSQEKEKFTLSIKSASDLLEPSKSDKKSPNNILNMEEMRDSISVSRISKSVSSPSVTSRNTPATSQQQLLLNTLQNFSMLGPRGLPMLPPCSSPMGMPGLQPRPLRPSLVPGTGSSLSEQLTRMSTGMADYMRVGLEELLKELSAQGSPEATIKGLQLELEKMQWRHGQEMAEMKQNVDMMMKEMKNNLEKETQRTIDSLKKQAEVERHKAIAETKKKQWCANCSKEAIFYCCWNTSYCDYPCQQAHWPSHMSTCSQVTNEEETGAAGAQETSKSVSKANSRTLTTDPIVNMGMSLPGAMPMSIGGMLGMPGAGMLGRMRASLPLRGGVPGVSIRPSVPGHLTISRPYFM